ncbi:MAG: HEAT repeat domain-containing protein [Verrucomicrobiota bacterium]
MLPRIVKFSACLAIFFVLCAGHYAEAATGPVLLDDRFELPPGFHVYRAASPELTGGSYDLVFDGEGRLLVGDGNAIRRLKDTDNDGVYDQFEVLATGLGWRGPQGMLVWGDRLYAVGGDGVQLFESYQSGQLVHRGRLGEKFNTGGDHDLHTILRGHDGWLYLMAGNGSGIEGRKHITRTNSPMLREREASVFRFDRDGRQWECLAAGGRNPPSLGMNYLGELFSFDSDMEWHVGLPWYKPVRLSHWAIGSDQGWQEVGAYPPYYIDCVSDILQVGRGSPNWGVFYEHEQWPARYRDAFLVCDYRWKRESNDQYATSGRLVAFFLERAGAGWKAQMELMARPKPGARDADDRPINFALVDVEVAPDGSVVISDHNQGLWRIFYDAEQKNPPVPPIVPGRSPLSQKKSEWLEELLYLPQSMSEWSRIREEQIRSKYGNELRAKLQEIVLDGDLPLRERLRAVQLIASDHAILDDAWLRKMAKDKQAEIRGQTAWLLGLREGEASLSTLLLLFDDADPFVRRRAAESLNRVGSPRVIAALIDHLGDPSRLTRFLSMNALAHYPTRDWIERAVWKSDPQIRMRALVASHIRQEPPAPELVRRVILSLIEQVLPSASVEDRLDLMRVLSLFEKTLDGDAAVKTQLTKFLLDSFPSEHRDVRWEQARLLGQFKVESAFGKLLEWLRSEKDPVTQFHVAQALARLPGGWSDAEERSAIDWMLTTQTGWFAEFESKGVEFPQFWATALSEFAKHHSAAVLQRVDQIEVTSLLGSALIDLLVERDPFGRQLIELYRTRDRAEARAKIGLAMRRVPDRSVSQFLRQELIRVNDQHLRHALLQGLSAQPSESENLPFLMQGFGEGNLDTARACGAALLRYRPEMTPALADLFMQRLVENPRLFHLSEKLLAASSGKQRPGYQADIDIHRRAEEPIRQSAIAFWKSWYAERFGHEFLAKTKPAPMERSDEEVFRFISSDASRGGNSSRGAAIYERLQCHTCHGGGAAPGREGRIFGPDLAGVTRRLSRTELAEALAYPSKQVADRFKAFELERKNGSVLTGFVTEQTEETVTFADQEQVHRIARSEIARLAAQNQSLMPERLLNSLSDEEMRDLLAFLENIGVPPQTN